MSQENKSFNLVDRAWIPVTDMQGKPGLISLMEVFTNGRNYADFAVRPHERVSLMRLLLCISHAALDGPANREEWGKVPEQLPSKAKVYLEKWRDSFDLFDPVKPFLQIPDLKKIGKEGKNEDEESESLISLSKLDYTAASGNNPALFDHNTNTEADTKFDSSKIVLQMISFQNFFLAGGKTAEMQWGGIRLGKNPPNPGDGPCSPSSMLHGFIRKKNIFNTIYHNLLTKVDLADQYSKLENDWWGKPIWEDFPAKRTDIKQIKNAEETYLGRMLPMTRLMRIFPDSSQVLIGEGLNYRSFNSKNPFPPEPSGTLILIEKDKNPKLTLLGYKPEKSIWRELSSIMVKQESGGKRGPLCLRNINEFESFDFQLLALARDKASAIELNESVYSLPAQIVQEPGRKTYETEVRFSEYVSKRLGWAVDKYRKEFDGGWEGRKEKAGPSKGKLINRLHSIATTHYWTTVENSLPILFRHIESIGTTSGEVDSTRKEWHQAVWNAARESYELVCGRETPRQIRAFTLGWQTLNRQDKTLNENGTDEENNIEEEESL